MPDQAGISAQLTSLARGDGEASEEFTVIGAITSISGIGGGSPTILNPTRLSDTHVRKLMGLLDEGQANITMQWDGDDDQFQGMWDDRVGRVRRNFQITYPEGTEITFTAYVSTFQIDSEVDSLLTVDCTLEIDGALGEPVWGGAES